MFCYIYDILLSWTNTYNYYDMCASDQQPILCWRTRPVSPGTSLRQGPPKSWLSPSLVLEPPEPSFFSFSPMSTPAAALPRAFWCGSERSSDHWPKMCASTENWSSWRSLWRKTPYPGLVQVILVLSSCTQLRYIMRYYVIWSIFVGFTVNSSPKICPHLGKRLGKPTGPQSPSPKRRGPFEGDILSWWTQRSLRSRAPARVGCWKPKIHA